MSLFQYLFWITKILFQRIVFVYNILRRKKKNRIKQQCHRNFIDWFISVPDRIIRSGHQIELKIYEHHY